jgi:hypothetical protein
VMPPLLRPSLLLLLLVLCVTMATALTHANRTEHVVVQCLPLRGHFFPIKAVVEVLLSRGHKVTLLAENPSWCEGHAGQPALNCVTIEHSGTFSDEMLQTVSEMPVLADTFTVVFEDLLRHHRVAMGTYLKAMETLMNSADPPTVIFADASTWVSYALAERFKLPRVQMFPIVLRLSLGPTVWVPMIGQGMPRELTYTMRLKNAFAEMLTSLISVFYLLPTLNADRAAHGIRPFKNIVELAGGYDITLAPTIWGYDIAQPLCPNVFPLGTLVPDHFSIPIETELQNFLESDHCVKHGSIYVNFGTLSVISPRLRDEILNLITSTQFKTCVVWKPNKQHWDAVQQYIGGAPVERRQSIFTAKYFASAVAIMQHSSTKAFVTHCGDTSFGEAVEANVPLIGIPFFADQADVCQRMQETGVGIYLGHKDEVTAADFAAAISKVTGNTTFIKEVQDGMHRLRRMARYLGGASRGADVIEAHARWRAGDVLRCTDSSAVALGTEDPETGAIDASTWAQLRASVRLMQWDVNFVTCVCPMIALYLIGRQLTRRCRTRRAVLRVKQD